MTETQLQEWLDAYGRAWESRDPDAAAALFTEDVEYYETPFGEPARGRTGVRDYWATATANQRDVVFRHQTLAVTPELGVARWNAGITRAGSGIRVRLDGIFVLAFAADGLCCELREWWHRSEEPRQDA